MIKILIVDDKEIIRNALQIILKPDKEIKVTGVCADGNQVLPFLKKNDVDVILMDIQMPQMNGIEATKLVKQHFPMIKVVMLSCSDDACCIEEAISSGASAFISKWDVKTDELKTILETAN